MAKKILWSIFLLLAVAVCVLVALSNYSSAPPAPPQVTPAQSKAAVARIAAAVKHPQPVAHPKSGATAGAGAAGRLISVKFAQSDVNTALATNSDALQQLKSAGVQAARVTFEPPSDVKVDAWFDAHGQKRQVQVVGRLSPTPAGGLSFQTVATRVGLLPLPAAVSAGDIDQRADALIAHALTSLPLSVDSVAIRRSELVLSGPAKKRR